MNQIALPIELIKVEFSHNDKKVAVVFFDEGQPKDADRELVYHYENWCFWNLFFSSNIQVSSILIDNQEASREELMTLANVDESQVDSDVWSFNPNTTVTVIETIN